MCLARARDCVPFLGAVFAVKFILAGSSLDLVQPEKATNARKPRPRTLARMSGRRCEGMSARKVWKVCVTLRGRDG